MLSAETATQKALRARLLASPTLLELVPADHILDRNARPNPDPAIIIGEGQSYEADDIARSVQRVVFDVHVWAKEPSLVGVKTIAGLIRTAVHSSRLILDPGFHCGDSRVSAMRFLRDPDGETSHAVVTVEAIVKGS